MVNSSSSYLQPASSSSFVVFLFPSLALLCLGVFLSLIAGCLLSIFRHFSRVESSEKRWMAPTKTSKRFRVQRRRALGSSCGGGGGSVVGGTVRDGSRRSHYGA